MRIQIAPSKVYRNRTVIPVPAPSVSPSWITLWWTRESWPATASISIGISYFSVVDKLWHPIAEANLKGGDWIDQNGVLRTEDWVGASPRNPVTNVRYPWFEIGKPIPMMRVVVDTTEPIQTALSVDWN